MRRNRRSYIIAWILTLVCLITGTGCIGVALWKNARTARETVQEVIHEFKSKDIPYQDISIERDSLDGKFYYQQLSSEEEKQVYQEILQGIQANTEDIYLHCTDADRANNIFQNVLDDHPEIFWCDGNALATAYSESLVTEAYVLFNPTYIYDQNEKEAKQQELETAAQECLNQIPAGASEYDKIKFVYEYLINTVEYDWSSPDNQNIYSALVEKASVCAGYAKSTQYLLEKSGIFCTYVIGTATDFSGNTEDHAWNIVKCNDAYYFVDTTWGDPIYQQDDDEDNVHAMTYDYLCCSGKELFETHTLEEGYAYPECVSEDLNYYRMNGMYYDSFDRQTILQAMYRSVEAKDDYIVFKFSSTDIYQEAHDPIVNDLVKQGASHLGEWYGLSEIWYSYEEDSNLNKLTIYWDYE